MIDQLPKYYAGVGSRKTPEVILSLMRELGEELSNGWVLRSGHADGADKAFEEGAVKGRGKMEIFLPWDGFNNGHRDKGHIVPRLSEYHFEIVKQAHPAYAWLSTTIRKLHARNVCQVLGEDLKTPVTCVLCWTPRGKGGGGTGSAIRIANLRQIPVFDFGNPDNIDKAKAFLNLN